MDVGKITHSQSQPGGMDRTPPGTPKKGGKMLAVRVQMLDDTITMFQVQAKAIGRVLFDQVCSQLHLLESDYFGLEYQEIGGTKYWLDLEKPLSRQIGLSLIDTLVRFCVKFYTPDPSQLEEEFTRYLFCLQIKRDLSQGLLQCNNNTAALMASYIVQAECGDYVVEDYPDFRYLSSYKFVPNQDQELEKRIMENHKKHSGQSPAEADLNLLETARRCELYGIKMHPAKDHEGVPLNLAVAHMGIVVFQNFTKINTFSWAKIRKISFKRKRFLVKLHPEGYGYYKDTVEFFFEGRNECKNFWKKCVENHGFFRCTTVKKVPRQKTRVLSRGSSFRYSGRTQKQIVDFVRENYIKRQTFQRSQSFRHSSSAHSSVANVGTSISAHPLLPLGENAVVGTPASLSCGSMTLTSSPVHAADIHVAGLPSPPATTSVSPGTSVTSSPQHFYPQENHFPRAGHQSTTVKHPHEHSHHGISPLQGPTSVVTPASTHSANLSNNNNNNNISNAILNTGEAKSSRITIIKSPDFTNFIDVYSNCYSSLRSLHNGIDTNEVNITGEKSEISDFNILPITDVSKSNESIGSAYKISQTFKRPRKENDRFWNRSMSYKDLYREENISPESENLQHLAKKSKMLYDNESTNVFDPLLNQQNRNRTKSFSATSKSTSMDCAADIINDIKMYSSTYSGTTTSLSIESAEEETEDKLVEVLDIKYDSQEEMALSHDDVSHDSYELLERESDDYENDLMKNRNRRIIGENDRARSCSWGSDRCISPMNFRSTDSVISAGNLKCRDNGFWSLQRERSQKHKSEVDFRSLGRKTSKENREGIHKSMVPIYRGRQNDAELEGSGTDIRDVIEILNKISTPQMESDMFGIQHLIEKEYLKFFEQKSWSCRQAGDFDHEFMNKPERSKYHIRKKSLEKFEPFLIKVDPEEKFTKEKDFRSDDRRRMEKRRDRKEKEERFHEGLKEKEEWEKEKERRQLERKKNLDEKKLREEKEEMARKIGMSGNEFSEFKEIHFKKFDRVVSNQFGRYSEFLIPDKETDLLAQERKVMENYERVCKVGKIVKEMEKIDKGSSTEPEYKNFISKSFHFESKPTEPEELLNFIESPQLSPILRRKDKISPFSSKAVVERTKSDSFNTKGNLRRNVLMHQKSIDLTSSQLEEGTTDHILEDGRLRKSSRSEQDIPYILHKRHIDGMQANVDFTVLKTDSKVVVCEPALNLVHSDAKSCRTASPTDTDPLYEEIGNQVSLVDDNMFLTAKNNIEWIHNEFEMDEKTVANKTIVKKFSSDIKLPIGKKLDLPENKNSTRNFGAKNQQPSELPKVISIEPKVIREMETQFRKTNQEKEEPIYAEVYRGKIIEKNDVDKMEANVPSNLPENNLTSTQFKFNREERKIDSEKKTYVSNREENALNDDPIKIATSEPYKNMAAQKPNISPEKEQEVPKTNVESKVKDEKIDETVKFSPSALNRGVQCSTSSVHRRKESLILFARTRLGMSEGSAFTLVNRKSSPANQRRTKSLDAPFVSVHRLPPVDAFSSKDDTVDGNETDVLPTTDRIKETFKRDIDVISTNKIECSEVESAVKIPSTFVEPDGKASLGKNLKVLEADIKTRTKNQPKLDSFSEEKVLDGIRSKRLLSKIESVDGIDSEGDLDSSKLTDALPIPSDRLVNLPESVRFPSVRQISGQTSEESADGWDQREVKVKRRTPRRSIGRDEGDDGVKESVVWDSKDDELPDDEVWDDNLVFSKQSEGSTTCDAIIPTDYLKRGSCGQSIDDDNLSTPMKESSPEHWVSVDDLPEAIEREEKLLRQQEKILREKILNEKLKRELNLDTIDVEEKYYDYNSGCFETDSMDIKGKFKGHSLDTYELTEKRLRERGTSKYCSLDEHILREKPMKNYVTVPTNFDNRSRDSFVSESMDSFSHQGNVEYIQCKVLNDVTEIEQFGNDEEVEEFFVVLDEKSENSKDTKSLIWERVETSRFLSNEESVISVPEEFRDDEDDKTSPNVYEIQMTGVTPKNKNEYVNGPDQLFLCQTLDESTSVLQECASRLASNGGNMRISSQKEQESIFAVLDDTGRLSPYECSYRRNSNDPGRHSGSDEPERLSPWNGSRRGSGEPRRLSSEDSRKCSISESFSEETRRRLSSTEETRRKRASLTKQCSVGAESPSDEMISGVPECSSSFEQDDEKDVFEAESITIDKPNKVVEYVNLQTLRVENGYENLKETNHEINTREEVPMKKRYEKTSKSENFHTEQESCIVSQLTTKDKVTGMPLKTTSSTHASDALSMESTHRKLTKVISGARIAPTFIPPDKSISILNSKGSFDSSQDSDVDKLSEVSVISHIQNQIAKRNLFDAGKCLRQDGLDVVEKCNVSTSEGSSCRTSSDEQAMTFGPLHSSEELERIERSPFEWKSDADEFFSGKQRSKKLSLKHGVDDKCNGRVKTGRDKRTPEQEKRDSGEDGSSSSSAPPHPKRELSSTWKPFLLESSGSSSLEENWLPPDENAHLADEEETSSTSNNQQDESGQDDLDYPTGMGYPAMNVSSAEMIVGGYGGVYALSRTLSRISERSTSEQERSDLEDDFTKPSSHSASAEEESILSSDRQPSLSSDPPSLRGSAGRIPDLPDDRSLSCYSISCADDNKVICEPFVSVIPPPLQADNWQSTASSSLHETLGVSHVETVYLEIYPEEVRKVMVGDPQTNDGNSSSDENQTLHEEGEFLHLSSDNISISTTTTTNTQDGTVIGPLSRKSARTTSLSEDVSVVSISERSTSMGALSRANSNFGNADELCSALKGSTYKIQAQLHDESSDAASMRSAYYSNDENTERRNDFISSGDVQVSSFCKNAEASIQGSKLLSKIRPPTLKSPTGNFGFFETPVSKVRSPTSQSRFFEPEESQGGVCSSSKSPTSRSESSSPKSSKRFFDSPVRRVFNICESSDVRSINCSLIGESNGRKNGKCVLQHRSAYTPYYSNVAEGAEKSFFGRYDTGSLERSKIMYSRKCRSYYSMVKAVPNEEEVDDSSSSEKDHIAANTLPRAGKKTKRRHRVAMDLEIRDGRIVAPPKTKTTIIENSDSDRSSPRKFVSSEKSRKTQSNV